MIEVPAGFQVMAPFDLVTDALSPLDMRKDDDGRLALGFHVGKQHCNPRGICHGGTWATLADIVMGVNVGLITGLTGPTVSLGIDFLSSANEGQWVEAQARVLRHTHRLAFADCFFTADGEAALRANAVFRRKYPPYHGSDRLREP